MHLNKQVEQCREGETKTWLPTKRRKQRPCLTPIYQSSTNKPINAHDYLMMSKGQLHSVARRQSQQQQQHRFPYPP